MLKISVFEIFIAVLPEVFVFVIGAYILANQRFDVKRITLIGLIAGIVTYFVRLLPIFPGANILFSILIMSALLVILGKMDVMKVIPPVLMLFIIRLVTEGLTILLLAGVLHMDLNVLANDPIKKTLAFIPSLLLFIFVILTIYIIKRRKRKTNTNVPD